MNLENYIPKGQLEGFPKEVIEWMLEHQVAQGNKEDVTVFEDDRECVHANGGFSWGRVPISYGFCVDVIRMMNFDVFFSKYPKATTESKYPKVMWVWDISEPKGGKEMVHAEVMIEGVKHYVTKNKEELGAYIWKYAKDIEEVQPPIPKTLEERVEAIEKHLNLNK